MSAVLDTPLNGLGMIPLTSTVEGLKKSRSCKDALNTVVNACKGEHLHSVSHPRLQSSNTHMSELVHPLRSTGCEFNLHNKSPTLKRLNMF